MSSSNKIQESIKTLKQLIAFNSVSSQSNCEVSDWVEQELRSLGFEVERTDYQDDDHVQKSNVIARRNPASAGAGQAREGLAYFCHTDVVPPGDWNGPGGDPFLAVTDQNRLYGRGSCDMKGSLATVMTAVSAIDVAQQKSPLWIVATADEERGFHGARHVVKHSSLYREIVQAQPLAIIGEPTDMQVVHAHKGIIGFEITSRGRAAHSSTLDGRNANKAMVPMLQTLLELGERSEAEDCYADQRFDPPILSWNFGIAEGGTAYNITPERSVAWVTLRPMPGIDGRDLIGVAKKQAKSLGLEYKVYPGGQPLWIDQDAGCVKQLCELTGTPPGTVCFATDGGEFGELDQRVVWGPGSIAQAHTTDEWISLDQLGLGIELYGAAIRKWCC